MWQLARAIAARVGQGFSFPFLVLMVAIIVAPPLAKRLRLPTTVLLVLAGMVIGPHVTGLLHGNEIALVAWGSFGLLYLMFSAGLELDVKLLAGTKRRAITFAVLSFLLPAVGGVLSGRALGYAWAAALLLGSNWGSHTLVTYPMLRAVGLGRNAAVTTVVGATAVTDTLAMLVLAVVSVHTKRTGSLAGEGVTIGAGLVVLVAWSFVVLPKFARWFFAQVGGERSYRVVFGMTALLSGAVLAEAASIDGIIGAFFAGIGMARVIPERSPLMDRLQLFGSALFIPTFLVSVGVRLDPRVLVLPHTLLFSAVFTVVVLGGKSLAAVIAGRAFRSTWPEIGVMAGLSGSQAAATLATTLVGARLGLFGSQTVNAVLVTIFVTLVVTPMLVGAFAKKVAQRSARSEALGSSVLVPVQDEQTLPLLDLAARVAAADGGIVLAVSVATESAPASVRDQMRRLAAKSDDWLARAGFESRSAFRVASSVEAGLRELLLADEATLLLLEWRSPSRGEDPIRAALDAPVPVIVVHRREETHGGPEPSEDIVVVGPHLGPGRTIGSDLALASIVARRLARGGRMTYVGTPAAPLASLFGSRPRLEHVETHEPFEWLAENFPRWVVFPGMALAREALARVPRLVDRGFLVALSSRPSERTEERRAGPPVRLRGPRRSLTFRGGPPSERKRP